MQASSREEPNLLSGLKLRGSPHLNPCVRILPDNLDDFDTTLSHSLKKTIPIQMPLELSLRKHHQRSKKQLLGLHLENRTVDGGRMEIRTIELELMDGSIVPFGDDSFVSFLCDAIISLNYLSNLMT